VKRLSEVLTPEEQGQTPTPDLIKMSNAFGQLKEDAQGNVWRTVGIVIATIGVLLVLGLAGWSDAQEWVR
jgi:hypothetical protein